MSAVRVAETGAPGGAAVRPMQPRDRQEVLAIAADTGYFGDPIRLVQEDPTLFCDLLYRYYVDLEPQHAWVAEQGGHVVGFIVGSLNSRAMRVRWLTRILPLIVGNAIGGRYHLGPSTRRRLAAEALANLRGEVPSVDLHTYPAHLHVNVDAGWRGQGLGRRLLEAYLGQLAAQGVRGVHLRTTNLNAAACHLYESMGFRLLSERHTREWQDVIAQPVVNRAYGLTL